MNLTVGITPSDKESLQIRIIHPYLGYCTEKTQLKSKLRKNANAHAIFAVLKPVKGKMKDEIPG
jgi:hypothetical protein